MKNKKKVNNKTKLSKSLVYKQIFNFLLEKKDDEEEKERKK